MLGASFLTITHTPGSYVDGDWVPGTPVETTIRGSVQPLTDRELEQLPEGYRTRARFSVFVPAEEPAPEVIDITEPAQSDTAVHNGRTYLIAGVKDWTGHVAGLPHRHYVLLERGADE